MNKLLAALTATVVMCTGTVAMAEEPSESSEQKVAPADPAAQKETTQAKIDAEAAAREAVKQEDQKVYRESMQKKQEKEKNKNTAEAMAEKKQAEIEKRKTRAQLQAAAKQKEKEERAAMIKARQEEMKKRKSP